MVFRMRARLGYGWFAWHPRFNPQADCEPGATRPAAAAEIDVARMAGWDRIDRRSVRTG
jgi:hypothetical protein